VPCVASVRISSGRECRLMWLFFLTLRSNAGMWNRMWMVYGPVHYVMVSIGEHYRCCFAYSGAKYGRYEESNRWRTYVDGWCKL